MHGGTGSEKGGVADFVKETTAQAFVNDVIGESRSCPVLVQFWTPRSGACEQLKPILEKAVIAVKGKAKLVRLNIDQHPSVSQQLGIKSVPAVVAFVDSRPVDGFLNVPSPSTIQAFVEKLTGNLRTRETQNTHKAANKSTADDAIIPTSEWSRLAENKSALISPAEYFHTIVVRTNSTIIKPTLDELAEIDDGRRNAETAASALHQEINTVADRISTWLKTLADQSCNIDHDVGSINSCNPNPNETLRQRFPNAFSSIDLNSIHQAWSRYATIPRGKRYEELANYRNIGLRVAGVAFGLFLVGSMFTDGVGFFKGMFLLGAAIGAGVAILNQVETSNHQSTIQSAYSDAHRQIATELDAVRETRERLISQCDADLEEAKHKFGEQERSLSSRYGQDVRNAKIAFDRVWEITGPLGAHFDPKVWSTWKPASEASNFLRIGGLVAPTSELDKRLRPPISLPALPALVPFAPGRGLCLTGSGNTKRRMIEAIQNIALRLVAGIPPGKLRFTFIDPVGLGQNVAPLLALGDHVEELVGGRAWSEPMHIEQRLAELTQHMETVIQKYLRDEHKTIENYNANAGQVVEAYRILIVCDFPVNCTDVAARRLASIAQNGPRCGVYPFVIVDADRPMPYGVSLEPVTAHLTSVVQKADSAVWFDPDFESWSLALDELPPSTVVQPIIKAHGELADIGMRVSVPFGDLIIHAGLNRPTWLDEKVKSSADELVVPLGPSGARKYQDLLFGRGTAHHALVVGQTGSGKSNLLHVLITALALKYPPDELELYLVDFKQGVEFKLYAEAALPHARVIAIQSEREFGLSVLRGLLAEMDKRGDQFRTAGVPGLADWRKRTGEKLPRILLLVDEFRVFFTADDSIATEATMIIDRLVSQGRAFGIHVVLASQTLAGSYALPRSITDQMAVRIVLQCTEADSRLALADDNPEARLLSRPGEAIYNDQRGLIEGNHRFQVADMGDDETRESIIRQYLVPRVDAWRGERRRPIIFEGHRPARLEECAPLANVLNVTAWPESARFVDIWLGEPIALRPPSAVRFLRQGGANLLMVMKDEGQAISLMQAGLLALAAQLSPTAAGFHIADMSSADGIWAGSFEHLANSLPHRKNVVGRRGLASTIEGIGRELDRRLDVETAQAENIFLMLVGLHRMHDLREGEGSSWSGTDTQPELRQTFAKILREGPEVGIHTLIWTDSQSSAARVFDRRMLGDCSRRVVGPMSEQDSLALIDEPAAGRLDKPHRLIRFDEDRPGELEVFRPYVAAKSDWFIAAARQITARST